MGAALGCTLQVASAYVNSPLWWPTINGEVPVSYYFGSGALSSSDWRTAFEQGRDDWNTRPTTRRIRFYQNQNYSQNSFNTYYSSLDEYGYASRASMPGSYQFSYCNAYGNTYPGRSTNANQRRSTAGHEQGHCLGIDHSNVSESIMRVGRNRDVIFSPRQDDVNALNAKYP